MSSKKCNPAPAQSPQGGAPSVPSTQPTHPQAPARPAHVPVTPQGLAPNHGSLSTATQPTPPRGRGNPPAQQPPRPPPQPSAKPQAQPGAAPKAYFTHPKKADLREYGHTNARTASVPRGSTVDAPLDPRYFRSQRP